MKAMTTPSVSFDSFHEFLRLMDDSFTMPKDDLRMKKRDSAKPKPTEDGDVGVRAPGARKFQGSPPAPRDHGERTIEAPKSRLTPPPPNMQENWTTEARKSWRNSSVPSKVMNMSQGQRYECRPCRCRGGDEEMTGREYSPLADTSVTVIGPHNYNSVPPTITPLLKMSSYPPSRLSETGSLTCDFTGDRVTKTRSPSTPFSVNTPRWKVSAQAEGVLPDGENRVDGSDDQEDTYVSYEQFQRWFPAKPPGTPPAPTVGPEQGEGKTPLKKTHRTEEPVSVMDQASRSSDAGKTASFIKREITGSRGARSPASHIPICGPGHINLADTPKTDPNQDSQGKGTSEDPNSQLYTPAPSKDKGLREAYNIGPSNVCRDGNDLHEEAPVCPPRYDTKHEFPSRVPFYNETPPTEDFRPWPSSDSVSSISRIEVNDNWEVLDAPPAELNTICGLCGGWVSSAEINRTPPHDTYSSITHHQNIPFDPKGLISGGGGMSAGN